jgi:hypothetical protein
MCLLPVVEITNEVDGTSYPGIVAMLIAPALASVALETTGIIKLQGNLLQPPPVPVSARAQRHRDLRAQSHWHQRLRVGASVATALQCRTIG